MGVILKIFSSFAFLDDLTLNFYLMLRMGLTLHFWMT